MKLLLAVVKKHYAVMDHYYVFKQAEVDDSEVPFTGEHVKTILMTSASEVKNLIASVMKRKGLTSSLKRLGAMTF